VGQQYGVIVGCHRMQDQTLGTQDIVHDRHSTDRRAPTMELDRPSVTQ
jgi:hypothetical protein